MFVARSLCVLLLLLLALPVSALDRVKAAQNMARQAAAAFEAGDHLRAAELYLQAFASDDTTPDYLYGAARAEHIGGKLDLAERDYAAYLGTPGAQDKTENARKYLIAVRGAMAEERAAAAKDAAKAGDWPLAAQRYHDALALSPDRVDCLFGEAAAKAQGGQTAAAIALFERYLREAPPDARDRGEAQVRLDALHGQKAPPPVVARPGEVRSPTRTLGWTLIASGAAVAATGLGLGIWSALDQADLKDQLAIDAKSGLVERIGYGAARQRASDILTRSVWAGVLGGVGVAAAVLGGWQLRRAPSGRAQAVLLPAANGASLLVHF